MRLGVADVDGEQHAARNASDVAGPGPALLGPAHGGRRLGGPPGASCTLKRLAVRRASLSPV